VEIEANVAKVGKEIVSDKVPKLGARILAAFSRMSHRKNSSVRSQTMVEATTPKTMTGSKSLLEPEEPAELELDFKDMVNGGRFKRDESSQEAFSPERTRQIAISEG
jgi:hypothetical protein